MLNKLTAFPASFFPGGKTLSLRAYIFLGFLCCALFLPGIAALPATDRDESLFAQASKQMIETGNYVDIRFQGKYRYQKPIGIYWLQAASVKLLNAHHLNEVWAYRVPSFLSATTVVLVTAALGALLFGPEVGFLGALMLAGCLLLNVEARQAKTDATLLASVMIMQYALARTYMGTKTIWANGVAFWTALAVGILIKGPIILLVLASTLLWLWRTDKKLTWFDALRPRFGIPYALLLIMPWFAAIMLESHGQFLKASAGHDMLGKLWQGQDRGMLPPGLHLLVFPALFFPFSLFAMLAVPDSWEARKEKAVRFCLGWIIPTWIVFEISLTKLPHYVLPAYPPIALLTARALCAGYPVLADRGRRWLVSLSVSLWFVIGAAFAVGISVFARLVNGVWDIPQIAAGAALVLAQSVSLVLLADRKKACVPVMVAGGLVFVAVTIGTTVPNLQHVWLSRDIVAEAQRIGTCDRTSIGTVGYEEPSLIFSGGTDTMVYLYPGYVAYEIERNPCRVAVVDAPHLRGFLTVIPLMMPDKNTPYPTLAGTLRGFSLGKNEPTQLYFYRMPTGTRMKP